MKQEKLKCPHCHSLEIEENKQYETKSNGHRILHICKNCGTTFSQTHGTFLFKLRKPIWLIVFVLNSLTEGMSINACQRTFKISKNTIYDWQGKMSELKDVMFLYSMCQKFIEMVVEGDELYTKVKKKCSTRRFVGLDYCLNRTPHTFYIVHEMW